MEYLEKIRAGFSSLTDIVPSDRTVILQSVLDLSSSNFRFKTGWINSLQSDGALQVEPYVFMTRNELNLVVWGMQTAIITLSASDSRKIIQSITDRISGMTDMKYSTETTLKNHFQKSFILPNYRSGLLDFSLDETLTWSDFKKKSTVKAIQAKRKSLDDYLNNSSNWRHPAGSGYEYIFIPLSLLP